MRSACVSFILPLTGPRCTWCCDGELKNEVGATERQGEERKRNPDADAGLWRKTGRRRWRESECVRVEGEKRKKKNREKPGGLWGGTIRVAEVEKFLRRRSLASVRPSCPLSHVVSLLFLSGGRQQINGGRRCARRLWKKDQPRMLLCSRNSSDRPAKS